MDASRALWKALMGSTMLVGGLFTTAPIAVAETDQNSVLYGDDNRQDLYEIENEAVVNLARATALMTYKKGLMADAEHKDDEVLHLRHETFSEAYSLCEEERFREQPLSGFCSSFLVKPDVMVTAGHCMQSEFECKSTIFVFDFNYDSNEKDPTVLKKGQIYQCKNIIKQTLSARTGLDFAIIQLDRPVTDREPLRFRKRGTIADKSALMVIGNPLGMPTKVASGAAVRDNSDKYSFVANLDSYQGNSGSAVFNAKTKAVEGILVRGEEDFEFDGVKNCHHSKRCENESCMGESVIRATAFAPFIPK